MSGAGQSPDRPLLQGEMSQPPPQRSTTPFWLSILNCLCPRSRHVIPVEREATMLATRQMALGTPEAVQANSPIVGVADAHLTVKTSVHAAVTPPPEQEGNAGICCGSLESPKSDSSMVQPTMEKLEIPMAAEECRDTNDLSKASCVTSANNIDDSNLFSHPKLFSTENPAITGEKIDENDCVGIGDPMAAEERVDTKDLAAVSCVNSVTSYDHAQPEDKQRNPSSTENSANAGGKPIDENESVIIEDSKAADERGVAKGVTEPSCVAGAGSISCAQLAVNQSNPSSTKNFETAGEEQIENETMGKLEPCQAFEVLSTTADNGTVDMDLDDLKAAEECSDADGVTESCFATSTNIPQNAEGTQIENKGVTEVGQCQPSIELSGRTTATVSPSNAPLDPSAVMDDRDPDGRPSRQKRKKAKGKKRAGHQESGRGGAGLVANY